MSFDKQVAYLRSVLAPGKNSMLSYLALFAMRHHLASKHSPSFSKKPVVRWYVGQLAKEYIKRYVNEVARGLEGFVQIGLLHEEGEKEGKSYYLREEFYPALFAVLEEIFGKEYMAMVKRSARFYKDRKDDFENWR
jgi:hypothetical protein